MHVLEMNCLMSVLRQMPSIALEPKVRWQRGVVLFEVAFVDAVILAAVPSIVLMI